jgi:hypothetical protein
MEREFEIAGMGAIGALLRRKERHVPEPGTLCANCGTELQGFYCHVCGQSTHDQHRSIWHLAWEGIEGLTHLDGRLGQTLPPLFFNPGKLARDHLDGRRARHVPPFRLFLISLLIFMFVLESLFHGATEHRTTVHGQTVSIQKPGGGAENVVFASPDQAKALIRAAVKPPVATPGKAAPAAVDHQDADVAEAVNAMDDSHAGDGAPFNVWLKEHLKRAVANKEFYIMVLFTWAHRLAILLLPILAGLLALVYVRRKQFFIYDHLIVSMQFLSFEFLIFALAWIIPDPLRGWALLIATIWTPVNLYMTLRGAYGSRRITAGIKTVFLWFSTMFLFSLLMTGLMTLALAEM